MLTLGTAALTERPAKRESLWVTEREHFNCCKCFLALHLTQHLSKQQETIFCSIIKYHHRKARQHLQGLNKCFLLYWPSSLPPARSWALWALTGTGWDHAGRGALPGTALPCRNCDCTPFLSLFSLRFFSLNVPCTLASVAFPVSHRPSWADGGGRRRPEEGCISRQFCNPSQECRRLFAVSFPYFPN